MHYSMKYELLFDYWSWVELSLHHIYIINVSIYRTIKAFSAKICPMHTKYVLFNSLCFIWIKNPLKSLWCTMYLSYFWCTMYLSYFSYASIKLWYNMLQHWVTDFVFKDKRRHFFLYVILQTKYNWFYCFNL